MTSPSSPSSIPVASNRITSRVLGTSIDAVDWDTAVDRISSWAQRHEGRYVCICNVHSVVTATQDARFMDVIEGADMATPDGAPVAWMLRRLGHAQQQRINGPDLMLRLCKRSEELGVSVFFLGSRPETLEALSSELKRQFPRLPIAGMFSPPFRPVSESEDKATVTMINGSGAGLVFVSLGCPKQEIWMADHRSQLSAVTVGVGAAFDFHAGTVRRAPHWMQRNGLEWLHRVISEPRRLWRRYLFTNCMFLVGVSLQLWRHRTGVAKR